MSNNTLAKQQPRVCFMLGEEEGDRTPPALRIVQAQTSSAHPPGSLTNRETDEAFLAAPVPFKDYALPVFIPLRMTSTYRAWADTAGELLYEGKPLEWVRDNHPGHLEPCSDRDGQNARAGRQIALVALPERYDEPLLLTFEKSALKTALTINQTECNRARRGEGPGAYVLEVIEKHYMSYKWFGFSKPRCQEPDPEELERAMAYRTQLENVMGQASPVKTFDAVDTEPGPVSEPPPPTGDDIPF